MVAGYLLEVYYFVVALQEWLEDCCFLKSEPLHKIKVKCEVSFIIKWHSEEELKKTKHYIHVLSLLYWNLDCCTLARDPGKKLDRFPGVGMQNFFRFSLSKMLHKTLWKLSGLDQSHFTASTTKSNLFTCGCSHGARQSNYGSKLKLDNHPFWQAQTKITLNQSG